MVSRTSASTIILANLLTVPPASRIALEYQGKSWTYGELAATAERFASALAARGIRSGDRVVTWLPNGLEWFVAAFGCYRLGAAQVSLNLKLTGHEVGEMIARTGAAALVCVSRADKAIDGAHLKSLRLVVHPGDEELTRSEGGYQRVGLSSLDRQWNANAIQTAAPTSEGIILPTSGTTSKPKLVVHTQVSVSRHMHDVAVACGMNMAGTRMLAVLPLCGGFGYTAAISTLCGGGTVVIGDSFAPEKTGLALRDLEITHMLGTNDMLDKMLDACDGDRPFPYLRMFGHANFVPHLSGLAEKAHAKNVHIRGMYGMTELMAGFAIQPANATLAYRDHAGGAPVCVGAAVRIVDPETGQPAQPGAIGELEVRTPNRMRCYLDDSAATDAAITFDGYFRTGDLGWIREDGAIVFESRANDVMRVGGYLVSPAEIEQVLLKDQTISQCQVVAVPVETAMRPVAFVVATGKAMPDVNALLNRCKELLAPFKRPVRIYTVPELPMIHGPNGSKVQRHILREWAVKRLGVQ
jgi:fatty-acyl-CoA synthase